MPSAEISARAAICNRDIDTLCNLLKEHPKLTRATNARGDNLLSEAARAGDKDVVLALLRHALSRPGTMATMLNHCNAKGETPLVLAIAAGHIEAASSLLEQAEINLALANRKQETPLYLASSQGNVELVKLLMRHPGNAPRSRYKKGETALVNLANANGQSPLAIAIHGRSHQVASELLKHPDIDVNAPNRKGESLLYQAVDRDDAESVRLLINDHRTRPDQRANNGQNPMERAMARGHVELVRLLATVPALANDLNKDDLRPLDLAVKTNNHAMIEALLESDAVGADLWDHEGLTPLERALNASTERPGDMRKYLRTLALLVGSNKVDSNADLSGGLTLLTVLCTVASHPQKFRLCRDALVGVLAVRGGQLDVNQPERGSGRTALEIAAIEGHHELAKLLLADPRTDANVLAPSLIYEPARMYAVLNGLSAYDPLPSMDEIDGFVQRTLLQFAAKRMHDGTLYLNTFLSSWSMGQWLVKQGQAGAEQSKAPMGCSKHAAYHFALALERYMDKALKFIVDTGDSWPMALSKDLLANAPANVPYFNLGGVDVSRTEVELWAAGRLPDALINGQIEQDMNEQGQANVHIPGLTSRGSRILTELRNRVPAKDRLSIEQSIEGITAAMETLNLTLQEKLTKVEGLMHALEPEQAEDVEEGLGTNVSEVLSAMWSYIQTFALPPAAAAHGPADSHKASSSNATPAVGETAMEKAKREQMHGNLLDAFLVRLGDIADDLPCNTGCVQRILYAVDGVDFSLTGVEPDQQAIGEEIKSLAAQVNERFETLYGASAEDPGDSSEAASTSAGSSLSAAERQVVARYQGGRPVDDDLLIEIKQDMLEARVMAELVGRRGWGEQSVKPELAKFKEWMAYV